MASKCFSNNPEYHYTQKIANYLKKNICWESTRSTRVDYIFFQVESTRDKICPTLLFSAFKLNKYQLDKSV
ncbi:hypothetical protein BpHYR1_049927 [Brachionus plicatilis]|uniref:Uncharacterized protein n=1 Tax=Brachionus plicatilis TaxID=10195 RepID=A0A3M7S5K2_BRAPC|nr:hypothetical protein BpHYR1_049927 [Brachionus plicatilis]